MSLAEPAEAIARLDEPSEREEPEAPLGRTLELARPAAGRLLASVLLGACAVGAAIGLIATSAWLISRAAQHPPESALGLAIVGVEFFGISRGLFRYAERLVGHDAAFRVLAELRVRVYRRLEQLAPAGLPAFRHGDLLARLVHDVDSLQDLLLRVAPPFAIAALVGAATVGAMWSILPWAGLILLATLLISASAVPWLTGYLAQRTETRQAAARADLTAAVVDLLEGSQELLAYGALDAQIARAADADSELAAVASSTSRTAGIGLALTTLLAGLAMWGALMVGVPAVRSGHLDGVLLAVIALVPLAAFELVAGLPAATQTLQRVRRAAARVFDVLDAPDPVREPVSPRHLPPPPAVLTTEDLRVRYADRAPWALDGVDLRLAPGRRVGVVGTSGAGKSTLAGVLLRFVSYQQGRVRFGHTDIDEVDGDELRTRVGMVSQEAHIFAGTLEDNLRIAKDDASNQDLMEALRVSRLTGLLESLPLGLMTVVGEDGRLISGGERQRLAIARAWLAGFEVLILDEPGEHLDTTTADAITADLLDISPEAAVLIFSHRLAGLESLDEILVLESGRVVERGRHADLLAAGGGFADLWRRERQRDLEGTEP